MDHELLEARRLALQAELDARKSQAERNKLGQFATPTALAREIVAAAVGFLRPDDPICFLDPAIGTGSFYCALLATVPRERIARAIGYEVDAHYGIPAAALLASTGLAYRMGDFTAAPLPMTEDRANLIVCNPPYVRHHHMTREEKMRLQDASELACGVRVAGLAGLHAYFLALSHGWMAEGGIAAWLTSSQFMDVNYGGAVKEYLLSKVTLLRIHRFDPNDVQFGDALVSSAVVWFRNSPPPKRHQVEFTFGGSVMHPRVHRTVATTDLAKEPKWTRYPVCGVREQYVGPRIKDFFTIRRGIATGGNEFFVMTAEQAVGRGIPAQFLRPVLPSPRYVKQSEILADADGNPKLDKQLFLLDCRLSADRVKAEHPTLWAYLSSGIPSVSGRYLCTRRSPWYSQEKRQPAPIICTYMGRNDGKGDVLPFRMILNRSKAIVTNVYLMLYPKPVLQRALNLRPEMLRQVWELLQSIRPQDMLGESRVYGGGLHKMEPKELANVPAEGIHALIEEVCGPLAHQPDLFPGAEAAE